MKRKITFLIAAIAAIMLITQPIKVLGQEKAEGDEITSISKIVSGKTYYIKGTRTSGGNTVIEYLKFTDSAGSQSGTSSNNTDGAVAITFTNVSGNTWRLTTPSGNYIAPGTSNGKINVSSSVINVTASNQGNKIRLSITSNNETWSIQKNTSGTNFGGYKNTQTDITLIEAPASKVATPSFSPSANTYNETQNVTISCATDDASIYYTMGADPADPTSSSTPYTGAITVSANTTIKAIAIKDGMTDSNIASASYQIRTTAPSFTPVAGTYSVAKSVTLSAADGASIYYTMGTDPADPTSSSTHYTDAIDVTTTTTIKAIAIKDGYANSNISTATYTIINDPCTLTLNSNDVISTVIVPKNEEYTLPTPINVPVGYGYLGWSVKNEGIEDGDVKTTITPTTDDATYYAVFKAASFDKVTGTNGTSYDWSGDYLIVCETANVAFNGTVESNWGRCSSVSIESSSISCDNVTAGYMVQISSSGSDVFKIKFPDDKYMSWTGEKSFTESTTAQSYSISSSSGNVSITTNSYTLKYNGSGGLRSYSSGQSAIQLYKLTYSGSYTITPLSTTITGNIAVSNPTTIPNSLTFTGNLTITETLTISGTAVVTVEGDITNSSAANLIIEDGGQLIASSSVAATFKKSMTAPSKVYGWELISSPVHDGTSSVIDVTHVTNLTTNTYDMFAYDEATHKWLNQKASAEPYSVGFPEMNVGEGYMYRNNAKELSFVGNTNSDAVDVVRDLTYTSGDLAGFHLVGNPYTHSITVKDNVSLLGDGDVALESGKQLSGYYLLTNGGSEWTSELGKTTDIATKQGFLIQIPAEAKKIKFSNGAKKDRAEADNIMFTVANSQFNDVAYALFDDAFGLNKINHRDADAPMLYINQNGQDYAIAAMSDDTKSFNLNFKAGTISQYTLRYKADGKFEYLHVIDRLTGEDVDMLLEGEYSFIGHPKDNENRFIVRLAYASDNNDSSNDIFAYQSGSEIYVTGNGELQIFDVTGRRVMTTTINGAESINIPAQGVYIFRLNEKVQKIVVR